MHGKTLIQQKPGNIYANFVGIKVKTFAFARENGHLKDYVIFVYGNHFSERTTQFQRIASTVIGSRVASKFCVDEWLVSVAQFAVAFTYDGHIVNELHAIGTEQTNLSTINGLHHFSQ
jgi:hypothetical protein